MAVEESKLKDLLVKAFPDAQIQIEDLAGDGDHYALTIKSVEFQNKNRVQQHKMVYDVLANIMASELHALAIKTEAL